MKTLTFSQRLKMAALIMWDTVKSTFTLRDSWIVERIAGAVGGWGRRGYVSLAEKAFENPYAYRAYQLIASNLASIEIVAQYETEQRQADGSVRTVLEDDPDHPFIQLLRRPSRDMGRIRFFSTMVLHLFFGGEVFIYAPETSLTGPRAGRPSDRLRLLRPDRVTEILRKNPDDPDEVTGYRYTDRRGRSQVLPAVRVLHIPLPHPFDGDRGYPLIQAVWRQIVLQEDGDDWNRSISQHRGQIPFVFEDARAAGTSTTVPRGGTLDDRTLQQRDEDLVKKWREKTARSEPWLLNPAYRISEQSLKATTPRDAEWLEGDKHAGRKIAVGLGIGSALLGDTERQTHSNLKAELWALMALTILPLLDLLLDEMNGWYMRMYPERPNRRLTYYRDRIEALQEDQTAKYERLFKATGRPFISPNEAREELGWSVLREPGADETWVPFNVVPASQVAMPGGADGSISEEPAEEERQLGRLKSLSDEEFEREINRILERVTLPTNGKH